MKSGTHICIYSGHRKEAALAKCAHCGRIPTTPEDKRKSIILSTDYYLPESDYLGKSASELLAIGEELQNGHPYQFDEEEVSRVVDYVNEAESITTGQLARSAATFWLPGIFLLSALALAAYFGSQS